jgi:hypothetical protein
LLPKIAVSIGRIHGGGEASFWIRPIVPAQKFAQIIKLPGMDIPAAIPYFTCCAKLKSK